MLSVKLFTPVWYLLLSPSFRDLGLSGIAPVLMACEVQCSPYPFGFVYAQIF